MRQALVNDINLLSLNTVLLDSKKTQFLFNVKLY